MQRIPFPIFRSSSRVLLGVFVVAVMLGVGESAHGQQAETQTAEDPNGAEYVAGELIVTYDDSNGLRSSTQTVGDLITQAEGDVIETLPAVNSQVVEFPGMDDASLEETRRELEGSPGVESADYNYLREVAEVPDDELYENQLNLKKVAAPVAWNKTTGEGATVAVVDTGIDSDHPDLEGKIVATTNTAEDGGSVEETSDGHGTHVAGIAAANTDNRVGVAGACPDCELMIAKTEDDRGLIRSSYVIEAINWAADNDADVINISLSGEGYVNAERQAVKRAMSAGSVVVAAAGNFRSNIKSYPAAYPEAIAVAATTAQDTQENYSNFGNWIDISAPGTAISTIPNDDYGTKKGTSMSSPLVAGVAAMISAQGDFSPQQIEKRLITSTVDLGERGRDATFGYGRLDAAAAVGARERNTFPTVSNRSPKPGATTGRRTTISATLRDAQTEVERSRVKLFIDDRPKSFTFNAKTGRLSREATFKPGRHSVKIVVRDGWGLSTMSRWTFRVS